MPEGERLTALAAHGATMVIFLSIGLIDKVQAALLQGAYTAATPAAVVYKATWPEEKILRCTVGTLAAQTQAAGITKTALIVVGDFLAAQYDRSCLYDPAFYDRVPQGDTAMSCAILPLRSAGWHWRSSWRRCAPARWRGAVQAARGWTNGRQRSLRHLMR